MLLKLVVSAIFSIASYGVVLAEELCPIRIERPHPKGNGRRVVSGQGETCVIQQIRSGTRSCYMSFEVQHGRLFRCGESFRGRWGVRDGNPSGFAATPIERDSRVALPKHLDDRKRWLAPVDNEGWEVRYPIEMDDYVELYPRRFTRIGKIMALDNPDFRVTTQTLRYVTMKGGPRAAATAQAAVGCLTLYFVAWAPQHAAEQAEQDLRTFVQDLRLKPVTDLPEGDRERICKPGP